ncbi:MAG: hypothetical protein K1Y02_21975 [Candidatus Hydrogenedentes bacterium]|nr:hypothetical protein [Candidatus Hydrogenedentota bacterium]
MALCALGACLFLSAGARIEAAESILPAGSDPPSLVSGHFPDRMHEFIWKNWNLVAPEKLAAILGANAQDIIAVADSMGLPPAAAIPPAQQGRDYYMLIRRNWHLLPYEQLLQLVEMTPERLAFALREDDALYQKLGRLKPQCDPLRYSPPDEAARNRSGEIKRIVAEEFGDALARPAEPRFTFLQQFQQRAVPSAVTDAHAAGSSQDAQLRFIYSYFAAFGDPLANARLDPYPDGLLQQLSALGINGVWLSVILRDMAPGGDAFPEFGAGHEQRLANLRSLTERASKFGIGVYLYLNEPRARPASFFEVEGRAGMAGIGAGDGFRTMCTSHPAVRKWLGDAVAHIFSQVPDLAGIFTITTGEAVTSCASYGDRPSCPRCKDRTDAEIVAEVNATLEEGVHRVSPNAKVIAWDWEWHNHGDVREIIDRLPKSVWVMSVSEWDLPLRRGGTETTVGEYSVSAVGPGPKAIRHWNWAKEAQLKTVAKVQLNNSWELSTVPYLPVMELVAEHCHNLASRGLDGMMLSWTLGGFPSPNLEIASRFQHSSPAPSPAETAHESAIPEVDAVLDALATQNYGEHGAAQARKAWHAFSTAFQEYPFHHSVMYFSPVHLGPSNPLYREKTGYTATMTGIPYDDLTTWRGPYPVDTFIAQFEKTAQGWQSGIPPLKAAGDAVPPERADGARAELRYAHVAAIHFQSVANQARFIVARDKLADAAQSLTDEEREALRNDIRNILRSEIDLAHQLFPLAQEDSRIGFEAANQYFYVPLDLVAKIINCRWLLNDFS